MHLSIRTLLVLFILSVSATLSFLAFLIVQEYSRPTLRSGSLGEPHRAIAQKEIQFDEGAFLKIGQPTGITFILSDPRTVSHKEMQCLAKNIYHEARGEGIAGMIGVAQITLNRVDIQYRGKKTLCDIVHDSNQFSWTNNNKNKKLDKISWQQSIHIAQLVILGIRIKEVNDSIYFHSNKIKSPKWTKDLPINGRIGGHVYHGNISG